MAGLLFCAGLAAGLGLFFLTQATIGVGLLALACLFAICGRIAQARAQHEELNTWAIKMTSERL